MGFIHYLLMLSCMLPCIAELSDNMHVYEDECLGEDRMFCADGSCVWKQQYCDGKLDCPDGSDENLCVDHTPDPELCASSGAHYLCEDKKKCIPDTWICNKETDCEDGSDEANCTTVQVNCTSSEHFECADKSGCIPNSRVCNSLSDCDDSSDEANCTIPIPQSALPNNGTACRGFTCKSDKRCISLFWVCDGAYDCADQSDESVDLCRRPSVFRGTCPEDGIAGLPYNITRFFKKFYLCRDESECLNSNRMCDGTIDCKDGSDEEDFCDTWYTMCLNKTCNGKAICRPERNGEPTCECLVDYQLYNQTTHQCEPVDACGMARPQCSHTCINGTKFYGFACRCEDGYISENPNNNFKCFAPDPEAMLFFTTPNEVKYITLKSKKIVTIATGVKQAHGVAFDGTFVYWVETAQGHQAIVRAPLDNVADTKTVLVGLGLEDPGDISIDFIGGNFYFSDAQRGTISACNIQTQLCTTINTDTRVPKHLTLDIKNGKMYWADYHERPVIMSAWMDGSAASALVPALLAPAAGLAVDAPGARLYYIDGTLKGARLDTGLAFTVNPRVPMFHEPRALTVFENSIYWSDWASNTIQNWRKQNGESFGPLLTLDSPVYGVHIFHPILTRVGRSPALANCSHLRLVGPGDRLVCACPDGLELDDTRLNCRPMKSYRPEYVVVGSESTFTRVQYNAVGGQPSVAVPFDIGHVQAMAYDTQRDVLYIYDSLWKAISTVSMSDFHLGSATMTWFMGLDNVVDMDYDYITDNLYILDAGRKFVEAISLRTGKMAVIYKFEHEIPRSLCVIPEYGKMFIAVSENEQDDTLHIDSLGLDGSSQQHLIMNNLKGPHVRLKFSRKMDAVYIADEGNNMIDYLHPEGTGLENFRELSTFVTELAVTDTLVLWTTRRSHRLYWADIHDASRNIRRVELSISDSPCGSRLRIGPPQLFLWVSYEATKETYLGNGQQRSPVLTINNNCDPQPACQAWGLWQHLPTKGEALVQQWTVIGRSTMFPNTADLHIQATWQPSNVSAHPCQSNPCSDVCVQTPRYSAPDYLNIVRIHYGEDESKLLSGFGEPDSDAKLGYRCLCPPGLAKVDGKCSELASCREDQAYCHLSNVCIEDTKRCDGNKDCEHGEDEEGCNGASTVPLSKCKPDEKLCVDMCIDKHITCVITSTAATTTTTEAGVCYPTEFACSSSYCVERSRLCDGERDCPDGADEYAALCDTLTCRHTEFTCSSGQCILEVFKCDGEVDCKDGSDEFSCVNKTCPPHQYQCRNLQCIDMTRRCDAQQDCADYSDEDNCVYFIDALFPEPDKEETEPENCPEWEYACELNRTICLPLSTRCNGFSDCPGSTDEANCENICQHRHMLFCKNERRCIINKQACDGHPDCADGEDETPEFCKKVNRTTKLYPTVPVFPSEECHDGYWCSGGQCIEWSNVCDQRPDCADGSDEGGMCVTSCTNHNCSYKCQPTPMGHKCRCPAGHTLGADSVSCEDVDECLLGLCSQHCYNTLGSFVCSCHKGYALRPDRRSCKAVNGNVSLIYASGNTVRSMSLDGHFALEYRADDRIVDIDYDVRKKTLYVTSADKLTEVNGTHGKVQITNVGKPTLVSLDWITGNVYFAELSERAPRLRVCHVRKRRCATLQRLPLGSNVTSLVVDPASRKLFYSVSRDSECVIYASSLAGRRAAQVGVGGCGVAADTFAKRLYVADAARTRLYATDYHGNHHRDIIKDKEHLQAPHNLIHFEDHIYFLDGKSSKLSRCLLFGKKHCEMYFERVLEGSSLVINHESVQRNDIPDYCEGMPCDNLCVQGDLEGICLCDDGAVSKDGKCPLPAKEVLPLFNGSVNRSYQSSHVAIAIVITLFVLSVFCIAAFAYRRYRKKTTEEAADYLPVHFQNSMAEGTPPGGTSEESVAGAKPAPAAPSVQMPTSLPSTSAGGSSTNEFVNPLQFFRNWRPSFRKRTTRPVGTAGLEINVPPMDVSDTESDLDEREQKPTIVNT